MLDSEWHMNDGPSFKKGVTNHQVRNNISNNLKNTAGGIDPTTGYTRRVMITMPWLNFQRPVSLGKLPKWSTFIAGKNSTVAARRKLQVSKNDNTKHGNNINTLYTAVVGILTCATLGVLIFQYKRV